MLTDLLARVLRFAAAVRTLEWVVRARTIVLFELLEAHLLLAVFTL